MSRSRADMIARLVRADREVYEEDPSCAVDDVRDLQTGIKKLYREMDDPELRAKWLEAHYCDALDVVERTELSNDEALRALLESTGFDSEVVEKVLRGDSPPG